MKRDAFSDEIWDVTYRAPGELSPIDTQNRLATACAEIEDPKIREQVKNDFLWLLSDFKSSSGGRITANLGVGGRKSTTLMNCYVWNAKDINFHDPDSIDGIYEILKRQALTLKSEGGYGINFSFIRPNGTYVSGIGGRTPGVLKFMELWDKSSEIITMGSEKIHGKRKDNEKKKIRKGAQMSVLEITHPEILDFIDAKLTENRFNKFNLSVGITKGFMQAVINDEDWNLEFPDTECEQYADTWQGDLSDWKSKNLPVVIYQTVKAKFIWDKILHATYTRNDPGVLFLDVANENNALSYAENIVTTNPCFHADTLIAVADGRNAVTIKQLADEGKDVSVYSVDPETGKISIKWGRNPRITGYDKGLIRVTLDDNSHLDVTPNHKFILLDGTTKEAKDLVSGDSLPRFKKKEEPVVKGKKPYYMIYGNVKDYKKDRIFEHRLIAKFYFDEEWNNLYTNLKSNGFSKTGGLVIHHKDYNQLNNSPDNLQIMSFSDHSKLHGSIDQAGEKNGRYIDISNEDLILKAKELTKSFGRRVSNSEWRDFASKNNLPQKFSNHRSSKIGSVSQMLESCAIDLGFEYVNVDTRLQETCKKLLAQGYDAFISGNQVLIKRKCELCSKEMISATREVSICMDCVSKGLGGKIYFDKKSESNKQLQAKTFSALKFNLGREPMRKEWEAECKKLEIPFRLGSQRAFQSYKEVKVAGNNYNHKVSKIEKLEGKHTVYNITVDDNHNLAVITDVGKSSQTGVFVANCGEVLMSCGICLLYSLNLAKFVKPVTNVIANYKSKFEFDYAEFARAVKIAVRFSDNINDISNVPLDEYKKSMLEKRRIGLGVLGLGSLHYILGIRFGSKESSELISKIFKLKAETEILASCELGKEKGNFPLFDKDKYFSTNWWKNLPISNEVKEKVEAIGCMRNSHRSANAPTGNMGIYLDNVSGGIEPVIFKSSNRWAIVPEASRYELRQAGFLFPDVSKGEWFETEHVKFELAGKDTVLKGEFEGNKYQVDRNRGLTKQYSSKDYGLRFVEENYSPEEIDQMEKDGVFATTNDLTVEEHIASLKALSPFVDMNSSKTINIPEDYSYEAFKNVYMDAYKAGIKGITTYRANTMACVIEDADKVKIKESVRPEKITHTFAPKRPTVLECEIHQPTVKGNKWVVLVGKLDNKPYEIFAGLSTMLSLPNKCTKGKIVKKGKGVYDLHVDVNGEDLIIKDVIKTFDNAESSWATRILSMSLRHGVPSDFIVEQLGRDGGIGDINRVLSRILKKYIAEGASVRTSNKCDSCGNNTLVYSEGCMMCTSCGYSKCN
jgi:ribonucleotide reductase alpha subunit